MKRFAMGTVVGLLLAGGLVVIAGFGGPGFRGPFGHRMSPERRSQMVSVFLDDTLDKIDATDTQREKAHAIKDRMFDKAMAMKTEQEAMRDQMIQLWLSDAPDHDQVYQLIDKRVDAMRTFAHEAADSMLEFHDLLTPEQREKAAEIARERHP